MIYKWNYIAIIFFLISNLNADSSIILYLKNGSIVETKVLEIAEWGIKLEDKKSVSYKVISNIEMNDSNYAAEIKRFFPQAKTYSTDRNFIIDLSDVIYDKAETKEYSIIQSGDITAGILFSSLEIINIQSSIEPSNFLNFSILFGVSFGWDNKTYQENDIDFEDFILTHSWNVGIGRLIRLENSSFSIFINYGNKDIQFKKEKDNSGSKYIYQIFTAAQIIYFASVSYRYNVFKNNSYISLGLRYYINDLSFDREKLEIKENNTIILKLGIGHSF